MEDDIQKLTIARFTDKDKSKIEDLVARERPLTIMLNNQELVTLLCWPTEHRFLAAGFLYSEGLINSKDQIKKITVDESRGIVRVETEEDTESSGELVFKRFITTGCGRGASFYSPADAGAMAKVESHIRLLAEDVFPLMKAFHRRSKVYKMTGGVHSAALCDTRDILLFAEDIGRHNAIDKIFGQCLLQDLPTDDHVIVTSGRISSEILLKVARRNIPIIISKSAPTDLGVKLADELGITVIGYVRGKRMNVYTHEWRVVTDEQK
ncbi:MAG: formate dehydrogenase accessory sulfurtransferase FdhD [Deltaproteobacteria bacterium]|nr:MAG: formate dehydrogenase accessory sulfurtransferase FdhD [Deltaproteobacteria bacterium]UCH07887.1 MAG: formate dehydrogenase accessory sulfurtransferase FdhD [Deltaproteobacteria bacterium]